VWWDSGKVASNQSLNVPYNGSEPLDADTAYEWMVKWWDGVGAASDFGSASFSTGLSAAQDWGGAIWIGGATGLYRKVFNVSKPVLRATAYTLGLGYYKLHANGVRVSTHELGAFTTFSERCYYDTIDLTKVSDKWRASTT
jgi:alpha-L-rhamnosidase